MKETLKTLAAILAWLLLAVLDLEAQGIRLSQEPKTNTIKAGDYFLITVTNNNAGTFSTRLFSYGDLCTFISTNLGSLTLQSTAAGQVQLNDGAGKPAVAIGNDKNTGYAFLVTNAATGAFWGVSTNGQATTSGTRYTVSTTNVIAETPIYTNSHTLTATNDLALDTRLDGHGPFDHFSLSGQYFFWGTDFKASNVFSTASGAWMTGRWSTNGAGKAVLYVKGTTNQPVNWTLNFDETWSTNGLVGIKSDSSLKLWLDADNGTYTDEGTTPAGNGDTIQQWAANAGAALHQPDAAKRPKLVTATINGHNAVEFTAASSTWMTNVFDAHVAEPVTIYMVASQKTTTGWQAFFGGNGVYDMMLRNINGTVSLVDQLGTSAAYAALGTSVWYQFTCVFDSSSTSANSVRTNGVACATPSLQTSAGQYYDGFTLGSGSDHVGQSLNGYVAFVAVYSGTHDAITRAQIEAYLKLRYGL